MNIYGSGINEYIWIWLNWIRYPWHIRIWSWCMVSVWTRFVLEFRHSTPSDTAPSDTCHNSKCCEDTHPLTRQRVMNDDRVCELVGSCDHVVFVRFLVGGEIVFYHMLVMITLQDFDRSVQHVISILNAKCENKFLVTCSKNSAYLPFHSKPNSDYHIIALRCKFCGNLQPCLHEIKQLLRSGRIQIETTRF